MHTGILNIVLGTQKMREVCALYTFQNSLCPERSSNHSICTDTVLIHQYFNLTVECSVLLTDHESSNTRCSVSWLHHVRNTKYYQKKNKVRVNFIVINKVKDPTTKVLSVGRITCNNVVLNGFNFRGSEAVCDGNCKTHVTCEKYLSDFWKVHWCLAPISSSFSSIKVHYPTATLLSGGTLSFQETSNFRNRFLMESVFINVFTDPCTFLTVILNRVP